MAEATQLLLRNDYDTVTVTGPDRDGMYEVEIRGYEPYAYLTAENVKELYEYVNSRLPSTTAGTEPEADRAELFEWCDTCEDYHYLT